MRRTGRPADKRLYVEAVMDSLDLSAASKDERIIIHESLRKMTCVELTILAKSLKKTTGWKHDLPQETNAQKKRLKILEYRLTDSV